MTPSEVYLRYLSDKYVKVRDEAEDWHRLAVAWRNTALVLAFVLIVVLGTEVVRVML